MKSIQNRSGKTSPLLWVVVIGVIALVAMLGYFMFGTPQTALSPAGSGGSGSSSNTVCLYQPTATYSAKDEFGTTVITGTSYYKVNGNAATTTAYSNTELNTPVTYWVQNTSTFYVQPATETIDTCTQIVEAVGVQNGSLTLTAYDVVGAATVTGGLSNVSMAANAQANIRYTYQPTAKKGFMPFGGVLVLEQNRTMPVSDITCNAPFLSDNSGTGAFSVTYAMQSGASNSYKVWKVDPSIEDGTGSPQTFTCQYNNGATAAGAGSAYYVTLIPANYYLTNDGNIVLDVEQAVNGLTTRTGLGQKVITNYWGA